MSEAAPATGAFDRLLDRIDGLMPSPGQWAYALRIYTAMMTALFLAFWLQLDSASSAATGVAILSQPKRGQVIAKAGYRLLGTFVGGLMSFLLMDLFGQDRVLLLGSFTLWLGLCVFTAQYLQDFRAYAAMLSGYTVAIIALTHIDSPQETFDAATARLAAITLAIVVVTFINDALASPSTWRSLLPPLSAAFTQVKAFARAALDGGDPGPERTAAAIGAVAPLRPDSNAIAGELDDGPARAAGARSAMAALYAMIATSRVLAQASAGVADPDPDVREALAICRTVAEGGPEAPDAAALERHGARLRALLDAAMRAGDRRLDAVVLLQRALDFVNAATFAQDGLRALGDGHAPLRDVRLPTHRDFPVALRAALRAVITFVLTAAFLVLAGLPQGAFALVQIAATCALISTAPDPRRFATGVLIGMPLAGVIAGIVLFGFLGGYQGYPLLMIAMAPPVLVGCLLAANPRTATIGFMLMVFFPVLMAPSNPQTYAFDVYLMNVALVVVACLILFLSVRLVLPIAPAQRRAYALESARRALADALAGAGGDATTRTSLNADRLFQFADHSSGSGAVRRAALIHAFALSQLEAAAARAHAQLRRIAASPTLASGAALAQGALTRGDAGGLERAAQALHAAVAGAEPDERRAVARLVADLATAARVIGRHRRFLRRLGVAPFGA